jgi:hypothetical protein
MDEENEDIMDIDEEEREDIDLIAKAANVLAILVKMEEVERVGIDRRLIPHQVEGRRGNIERPRRGVVGDLLASYDSRTYRLPRPVFDSILARCRPHLSTHGSAIPAEFQLLICLSFLRGSSYLDISSKFHVAVPTVYAILDRMMDVLDQILLPIYFPNTKEELDAIAKALSKRSQGILVGICGIVDGYHVEICSPSRKSVENPLSYQDRSKNTSILMIACVDHCQRFRFVSIRTVGSSHDSSAFRESELGGMIKRLNEIRKKAQRGANLSPEETDLFRLYENRYLIGDAAFPGSTFFLKPYSISSCRQNQAHDTFNLQMSRVRIMVEQSFGELFVTWGLQWRRLQILLEKIPTLMMVLVRLHNERANYLQDSSLRRIMELKDAEALNSFNKMVKTMEASEVIDGSEEMFRRDVLATKLHEKISLRRQL